jgi:hypothetical protein
MGFLVSFSGPSGKESRVTSIFPKWMNHLPTAAAIGGAGTAALVVALVWYYFTPKYWAVGYMPTQPGGGFNHQIHAGKLGMDCRYCHSNVEKSPEANIPTVSTCYGCHAEGKLKKLNESPDHKAKTEFIRTAYKAGLPIEWRRVHKVPDYVRNFPHHAHVNAGVSCISCHGNIARMPVVWQVESLSMSWCLDCHREPEPNLVPKKGDSDGAGGQVLESLVTRLFEVEKDWRNNPAKAEQQKKWFDERHISGPENCGACHY